MTLESAFKPLEVEGIAPLAAQMKEQGWRYVQMLCVNTEEGIDVIYSFMKDGVLDNYEVKGVKKGTTIPSITDQFLAAFVFENEAHDLFGIDISNIAIDFEGNFYALSQKEPMTVVSPEQHAARQKAAKLAALKAKKASEAQARFEADHPDAKGTDKGGFIEPPDADDLETRMAGVDPEKVARVKAAIAAKAKKAAEAAEAAKKAETEAKIANLDPEKAAKLKVALEAKAAREAAKEQAAAGASDADAKEGE